jgi:hypothetical protein
MSRLLLVVILLSSCLSVVAQSTDRVEIFGGVSVARVALCGPNSTSCSFNQNEPGPTTTTYPGWNVSATGYIFKSFGLTADFAGYRRQASIPQGAPGDSVHTSFVTYLFGPVYAYHVRNASLFAHTLFGEATRQINLSNVQQPTSFAFLVGGGVDVNARRHIAVRLAELDYERLDLPKGTYAPASNTSSFRYSGGIVFKF